MNEKLIRETVIDKVVRYIAPEKALRRFAARTALAMYGMPLSPHSGYGRGIYEGASKRRRGLQNYLPKSGSADADIIPDLPTLRDRSRDLAANNPLAGGAIHNVVSNVVGIGIKLNSVIERAALGMTEQEAIDFEKAAERGFNHWAAGCDIERQMTFFEIQELAFRSTLESGDCFVLLPYRKNGDDRFGLKLQLVEADRVCNESNAVDTETMISGVEVDTDGAPIRYHIMTTHPGEAHTVRRVWKAYDARGKTGRPLILHLYRRLRIGQHRGVPYLAPIIESIKQLGRYTEAEIMAAVVSGMFTVFTHTETGQGFPAIDPTAEATSRTSQDDDAVKLGYGAIIDIGMGDKIDFANPNRPNAQFDPFIQAVTRYIGVALELPYEVLIKHFTSSYSAARAALLEAGRFYGTRRSWLTRSLCEPVYEAWMTEAVASGYLNAPGYFSDPMMRSYYLGAQWIGPTQGQIDPVKEVTAAQKRIELRLTTRSEECVALTGTDWERKVSHMRREDEILGITGQPTGTTGTVDTNDDDDSNIDENEENQSTTDE